MKYGNGKNLVEQQNKIFETLIQFNDRENFIKQSGPQGSKKFLRKLFLKRCPLKAVDKETLKLIQVLRLHKTIDYTESLTGSAVLLRSLVMPSTDLEFIKSKQIALKEIDTKDKLRQALQDLVHEFCKGEGALYKFFNKDLYAIFPYGDLKRAKKSAANITEVMKKIPKAESSYLKGLIAILRQYKNSSVDQMMRGPIYNTFNGLKSKNEVGFFTPKLKFIPHRFSKWIFAGPIVAMVPYIYNKIEIGPHISPLMSTIGLAWTGIYLFYSFIVKPVKDTGNFIEPLRKKCISDEGFGQVIDTVGMIDELLSYHRFAREWPHTKTLPIVKNNIHHSFDATSLKNPILAKEKKDCIPNDVKMNGNRLSFITGPNSGGKTTICKSIVQNQLLAQAGCYVMAENAEINIADMVSYQAPKFDGLQDDEGRFGTELSRTRDIFYSTSPRSLVILDELAEGTTYEERLHESYGILNDFNTIGNNTVLVTHNHSLVDRFMVEKKGQCLMAEFNGDDPTYRIVPGISRVSHADRITKKINFSQEDRHQYMKEKGYM
jgi:DNA mismatch repair ATPase MutS